jgi:hypothetical protein
MTVTLREKYLNRADNEARIALVSQRSGRMLAVGAKRLPAWGGPLATLAIAIMTVLVIKYVKHLIGEHRCNAPVAQRTEQARPKRKVAGSSPARGSTTSNRRKENIITENTQSTGVETTEATAVETTEAAPELSEKEVQETYLKLAQEVRNQFHAAVRAEVRRQIDSGYLRNDDRAKIFALAGIETPNEGILTLRVPVTAYHRYRANSDKTNEEILANLREYSKYDLAMMPVVDRENVEVHYDRVVGLPVEATSGEGVAETAASILAQVAKAKSDIRDWVKNQRGRWCQPGINQALGNVAIEELPTPRYWTLTRNLVGGGVATLQVYALDEATALAEADWDDASYEGVTFEDEIEVSAT